MWWQPYCLQIKSDSGPPWVELPDLEMALFPVYLSLSDSFSFFIILWNQTPNLFSDILFQDENISWAGRAWGRTSLHIPLVPVAWMCSGVGTSLGSEPPNSLFPLLPVLGYWTSVVHARWAVYHWSTSSTQCYWSLALSFCMCMWVVCACLCVCVFACMWVVVISPAPFPTFLVER